MRYNPDLAPDPKRWLATADADRVAVVREYHKRARLRSGSPQLHAVIHVTVETQLAEGHASAIAAMARLLSGGLGRHEAIHAIGSVVAKEIYHVVRSRRPHDAEAYARKLDKLTAEAWLSEGEE